MKCITGYQTYDGKFDSTYSINIKNKFLKTLSGEDLAHVLASITRHLCDFFVETSEKLPSRKTVEDYVNANLHILADIENEGGAMRHA